MVITKLDNANFEVINNHIGRPGDLANALNYLASIVDVEKDRFDVVAWFKKHIEAIRFGMANIIAKTLIDVAAALRDQNRRLNLQQLFDEIFIPAAMAMAERKPSIKDGKAYDKDGKLSGFFGALGKYCLMAHDCFDDQLNKPEHPMYKDARFLESHLYYFINPVSSDDWYFYTATEGDKFCYLKNGNCYEMTSEKDKTYFKASELLTFFTCLFVSLSGTIGKYINEFRINQEGHRQDKNNLRKPVASITSGNTFEVEAAFAVTDASHHGHSHTQVASLAPKDGLNFIKNVILNFERVETLNINLAFPSTSDSSVDQFNLETFLSLCRIPFLYSINRYDAQIEQLKDFSGLYLRQYERTNNEAQIDARFEFKENGVTKQLVVECHDISGGIRSQNVFKCIHGAIKNSARLCSMFGSSFRDIQNNADFFKLCTENSVNPYILSKLSDSAYMFFQFGTDVHTDKPKMILLFIGMDEIHNRPLDDEENPIEILPVAMQVD